MGTCRRLESCGSTAVRRRTAGRAYLRGPSAVRDLLDALPRRRLGRRPTCPASTGPPPERRILPAASKRRSSCIRCGGGGGKGTGPEGNESEWYEGFWYQNKVYIIRDCYNQRVGKRDRKVRSVSSLLKQNYLCTNDASACAVVWLDIVPLSNARPQIFEPGRLELLDALIFAIWQ